MTQFGIVADDLTGAMDAGLQFTVFGFRTVVCWGSCPPVEDSVLVMDTESREVPPDAASRRARWAARQLEGRTIYKKIDSTLRGNIGAELDAVLDELSLKWALVSPAFPVSGRTVEEGYLLVDGVRLRETDFSKDPLCPPSDHIPALLRAQTRRPVEYIELAQVRQGFQALRDHVAPRTDSVCVFDAVSEEDLLMIARAAASLGPQCLTCGSAGLAKALPAAFDAISPSHRPQEVNDAKGKPVLLVVGSLREKTMRQLRRALEAGETSLVEINARTLEASAERAVEWGSRELDAGDNVVLTSVLGDFVPDCSEAVAERLGSIAASLVQSYAVSGLVLTGGAVAVAVCQELGIGSLEIERELGPGVPAGRALGGAWDGMKVVTKAGGFGGDNILVKAIRYLRGAT